MSGVAMMHKPARRRLAARWAAAALLASSLTVQAVDLDIAVSDSARRNAVAPHCAALLKKRGAPSPQENYRKGLCLLYGIRTAVRTAEGSQLLRGAADAGLVKAQMALGDNLQKGDDADQRLALIWYERADLAGDTRAHGRALRLRQKLGMTNSDAGSSGATSETPSNMVVDPTEDELQTLRSAGYHCHLRSGQQWCHNSME